MTMPDVRDAQFNPGDPAVVAGDEYIDYFGFESNETFTMPDGKQKIFFKKMNEGERAAFQKRTSKDIKFNRATNDAAIRADPAEERHELLQTSITGWSLVRRNGSTWEPVPFSKGGSNSALSQWLRVADPKIVDELEFAIRTANPWMQADMSVAEIDKEMDRLREMRVQAEEREAKK